MMLLVVALDRLIAVSFPIRYFKFSVRYGWVVVVCSYGFLFVLGTIGGTTAYPYQHPEKPAVCMSSYAFTDWFSNLQFLIQCMSIVLCIPVYIAVALVFKKKQGHVWPEGTVAHESFLKLQRRLVITLAISSIFSFLFYEVPTLLLFASWIFDLPGLQFGSMGPVFYALSLLNPILNLFIYAVRHKDIRLGIRFFFQCKKLTQVHLNQ